MLPPKAPGVAVLIASLRAGATPTQPSIGRSGNVSVVGRRSASVMRATPAALSSCQITRFGSRDGYDFAVGDAVKAYDGALTRAQRTIVYLRPNVVVIYDNLASKTPRTWEWNIHAVNQMAVAGSKVMITNAGQTLCITPLAAPANAFTQTNQFTAAPGISAPNQWHGKYATTAKSTKSTAAVEPTPPSSTASTSAEVWSRSQ